MPDTAASESESTRAVAVLQTHLDHLERPLRYATRQNFAHLAKLRDLEVYVQHHVQALQASPLPPGLLPLLQQLLQAVQDVDALPLLQKRERVRQAELLLAQMRASTSHDTAPSPATASAEGRQLNGAPFPASVTAEGAQLNVPPSPVRSDSTRRAASLGVGPSASPAARMGPTQVGHP